MKNVGKKNEAVRNAWLIKTLTALAPGLRILDAGAGEQKNKALCGHLQYVSQDFGQYDGKGDGKGLQTDTWDYSKLNIVSDITTIPEPDESFDVILCSEVIEHLPKPINAIKEFNRLLKNDGILILTAPFCSITHFAPYHYYSGYNRYFYEQLLPENEFKIIELEANGNYFEYLAQEIRRIPLMAKKFSNIKTGRIFRWASKIILSGLERFSSLDTESNNLLCFGYHVKAIKRKK